MALEKTELFGGLANILLPEKRVDMGHGITVSRTFAHLMAPFMMAFKPAEPEQPHPAPWKAASGGFGFDIHAELHVPTTFQPHGFFDRLNTVWFLVGLLRFRASPFIISPVISSVSFSKAAETDEEVQFWPMEVENRLLIVEKEACHEVTPENLDWIKANWWQAGKLMNRSQRLQSAVPVMLAVHLHPERVPGDALALGRT